MRSTRFQADWEICRLVSLQRTGGKTMATEENYQAGSMPQWPARLLTMPDSDEYVVVRSEKLQQLSEHRISIPFEGFLACVGIAGGSIVPAGVALYKWPLDVDGFFSVALLIGGLVGAAVFAAFCWGRRNKFKTLLESIQGGPKYISRGKGLELVEGPENEQEKEQS